MLSESSLNNNKDGNKMSQMTSDYCQISELIISAGTEKHR